jgi:hypothetical protein
MDTAWLEGISMIDKINAFFSPSIKVVWRGHWNKGPAAFMPDTTQDERILRQFMQEAQVSLNNGVRFQEADYDKVLSAAGRHGYGIEAIGGPTEETADTN